MRDLLDDYIRRAQKRIEDDMLHRPNPEIAEAFRQLSKADKEERDFMAGKPIVLPDGRIAVRDPADPEKAYLIGKPTAASSPR